MSVIFKIDLRIYIAETVKKIVSIKGRDRLDMVINPILAGVLEKSAKKLQMCKFIVKMFAK